LQAFAALSLFLGMATRLSWLQVKSNSNIWFRPSAWAKLLGFRPRRPDYLLEVQCIQNLHQKTCITYL
jgi:hypothetical protein